MIKMKIFIYKGLCGGNLINKYSKCLSLWVGEILDKLW